MNKNHFFWILLCFFINLSNVSVAQKKEKKALFIIVDGIPADVIEKVNTPNLHKITAAGNYLRAYVGGEKDTYSQTPTVSAVGYNSLLTGTWVNKHNVNDNAIKAPDYNYWNVFRLLKEQYPEKKTAVFSSWLDNRTKLAGDGLQAAGNIQTDYYADGFELDTISYPRGAHRFNSIDDTVTDSAVYYIHEKAPDLSWVYLEYTDDMGHLYGDGPEYYDAVKKMDVRIGRIWNAVASRQKQHNEEWLIFITTDHGRSEMNGKNHGGQTPRQRSTWMVTNYKKLNAYARYFRPGIVDIMPTLARFMDLNLKAEKWKEVDGIPLTGPVSLCDVKLNFFQQQIDISWQALEEKGMVKVWVATTNDFKKGGTDKYILKAEVPLTQGHTVFDVKDLSSKFYKVVLEAPSGYFNKWIVLD